MKRSAELVGMDGDLCSGHSLRSSLVTAAAEGGANEVAIMQTTGHKSSAMVRRYIRRVEAFKNNAASAVGCDPVAAPQKSTLSDWRGAPLTTTPCVASDGTIHLLMVCSST